MLQTHLKNVGHWLFKDVWAPVWQKVKQQIRCMKNSFLAALTGEIRSYPVAQKISTPGRVNIGVWVFSTVLWVIISDQEVAFFLHLVYPLLWHQAFLWRYTKWTLGGARAANSSTDRFFLWGSWLDEVQAETQI